MTKAPRVLNIAAIALIGIFCLQALLAIRRLSATSDEPIHLAAGYSYLQTRDFRMNPEHPPLAKLLAALPLLALHPRFDTSEQNWKAAVQDAFAFEFLYGNDADRLLFWSRAVMVLIAALGAAVTFLWARDLFGPAAGIFAVTLYAFCPNLLAHGMLVTTDVPVAVFGILTLYLFWKRGEQPSWLSDFSTGLALGAAMTVKFSGALLPIVLAGFCLVRKQIKSLFIMAAACLLVIEAARGFGERWGEMILLVSIALFLAATTIFAGQVGVRYILPVFPLVFVWVSRIVPRFLAARSGTVALAALVAWHAWSSASAFPNYIPYFNEMAGGAAGGPALLDDSNIDWGQGLKQAAEYVRKRQLENVNIVFFNPFGGPGSEYYGLPKNFRDGDVVDRMLVRKPTPGTYIISSHYVARLSHLNPAWKLYKPIDRIGESLWVYAF